MLTIHTPISLTVNPSMLQLNENFTERLTGNYKVIGNGLEPEDMLHFMSEPPEVYLAEGGMTALVDHQTVYENRSLKLDVINNVLNRILVADTYRMTYQDQVFIQSVLSRIGVTDVTEFIRQVQSLRQESKNINRLTDLYWSESTMLSELLAYRQERKEQEHAEDAGEEKPAEEPVLWLHQNILNRLQTGAVYQEIKNYLSATSSYHRMISSAEMQISEQTVTAQNILLNKLKNHTTMEEQPLVYHYINTYEMGDETQIQEQHKQTVSQLVQAVLLNALHQMYALRMDELLRQSNVWYQLAGAVYQAAENTYQRYDAYHERNYISRREADTYTRTVQQYQQNEIQAIEQFFTVDRQNTVLNRVEGEIRLAELIPVPGAEGTEVESAALQTADQGQSVEQLVQRELHHQQIRSVTTQEELFKQQLEQINQNNIRNSQLLQQYMAGQPGEKENGRINRKAAKRDALLALSQPKEVMLTYLESRTREEQKETVAREQLTQVFGERTLKIFETLEKYQKTPELLTATGQVVPDAAGMLMRDIQLRMQENRQELVHDTRELVQESVQESQTKQVLREFLPEQVRQIHSRTQSEINRVELLHRQTENTFDEEVLEEIRGLQRSTRVENHQIREEVAEKNLTQEIVNRKVNEFQVRQNEELNCLIQEKVQRQLGDLSEQVYGKLEKRMDTERRRRGL